MKNILIYLLIPFTAICQLVPSNTNYNQNIVWQNVFTDGPSGKVNRGLVDSDGNCVVVFMPQNMSRIHKIDGANGQLIWSKTINNTVGFGITEIYDSGRSDYIVSGGIGANQERWLARLNGNDGSIIWDKTYNYSGGSNEFDGIRMTMIGSDDYLYASGFIGGDEAGTIFIVYAGQEVVMKVDPSNGNEIWTDINPNSEYSIAIVESDNEYIYSAGVRWDEDLSITKIDKFGNRLWTEDIPNTTDIIPADLCISEDDIIYYGGHTGRFGAGDPFDYSCISIDTNMNVNWIKHYANPRGYSLSHIRNELYGIKAGTDGIYMFGGTGDEGSYSETNPPFLSSDIWNGWVLSVDQNGDILKSDIYCHDQVNTATEYGALTGNGYVIFNDTDAQGDEEVGVMKIINDSNGPTSVYNNLTKDSKLLIKVIDFLGRETAEIKSQPLYYFYDDGTVEKKIIIE
tara:strand:- start:2846 stop:4213 length:1368 start_codon:yes stop_codon:yes gene_type:complete